MLSEEKQNIWCNILYQWYSTFHSLLPPPKDSQHSWPPAHQLSFAISQQTYLVKASACAPWRTAPQCPPRAVEKPFLRLKHLLDILFLLWITSRPNNGKWNWIDVKKGYHNIICHPEPIANMRCSAISCWAFVVFNQFLAVSLDCSEYFVLSLV